MFYYGHRIEVESAGDDRRTLQLKGVYSSGFDIFVLPASFVRSASAHHDLLERFAIGTPWWDYFLPILALHLGYPTKRIAQRVPYALHYSHEARFSQAVWESVGLQFIESLRVMQASGQSAAQSFLDDVLALVAQETDALRRLQRVSAFVCSELP